MVQGARAEDAPSPPIVGEARRLYQRGADRGLVLRLTGSLAIREHCPRLGHLLDLLGRDHYRDIDFLAYSNQKREILSLFEALGYEPDPSLMRAQEFGIKRLIFRQPDRKVKVDVFLDDLVMAHTIPHKDRLELDAPTVSLVDLLLSKLQIHEITENDLKDTLILLAEHDLGEGHEETVDLPYLLDRIRRDWGFYYTMMRNVDLAEGALDRYTALLPEVREVVLQRFRTLRDRVDTEPKTARWRLRAKIGTRIRWYEEVEEVDRR